MKKLYIMIITMLFTGVMYSQNPWTLLTSGITQTLNGINFPKDNIGYVVGVGGIELRTTNAGATWTPSTTTGTTNDLHSVKFTSLNTGYATGNSGTIVKTIDGGVNWTALSSGSSEAFRFIFFSDANTGYVCGTTGTILKTINAGVSWNPLTTNTSNAIYGLYFSDSNNGCAVGLNGTVLYTSDGGSTWLAGNSGTTTVLYYVYFTSVLNGFAVGDNSVAIKTVDGGHTWSAMNTGTTGINLCGIKFLAPNTGFISGGNVTANTSTILKTNDGGNTWVLQTTAGNRLARVSVPNYIAGYACGLNGTIIKTEGINTGINELENNIGCDIFPNPSKGIFQITINDDSNKKTFVKVFNSIGEVIYIEEKQTNILTLDLSKQAKGTYFIQITDENKNTINKKIVIQ